MRRLLLITLLSLFIFSSFTELKAQTWLWANEAHPGTGDTYADHCIASDAAGNAYFTGWFGGSLTFGTQLVSTSYFDEFLVKYNAAGNVLWARQNTHTTDFSDYGFGYAVATDNAGNAYITGYFTGTFTFGTHTITSPAMNVYLVKYNSSGNVVWATCGQLGSGATARGFSVATDNKCNVYLTGNFTDTVHFGSYPVINGSVFLVKYDSSGHVIWARQSTPGGGVASVATDAGRNIYLTGNYSGSFSFGSFMLPNGSGIFLTRYDSAGNVKWAKDATYSSSLSSASVAVDGSQDIYITGTVAGNANFGGHPLNDPEPNYAAYLAKYDSLGNNIWVSPGLNVDGNSWNGYALTCDTLKSGGCYLTLNCYGGGNGRLLFGHDTFKLAAATTYPTATGLIQFDSAGNPLCGSMFTEGMEDDGDGIVSDRSGRHIYMGADTYDPTVLGTDSLLYGGGDIPFVARWQSCTDTTIEEGTPKITQQIPSISVYPNPSNGIFTISIRNCELGIRNIEIYNVLGERVYGATLKQVQGDNRIELNQPNGIYLYRVVSENGTMLGNCKIVIEN